MRVRRNHTLCLSRLKLLYSSTFRWVSCLQGHCFDLQKNYLFELMIKFIKILKLVSFLVNDFVLVHSLSAFPNSKRYFMQRKQWSVLRCTKKIKRENFLTKVTNRYCLYLEKRIIKNMD